jgi:hypothetical protein
VLAGDQLVAIRMRHPVHTIGATLNVHLLVPGQPLKTGLTSSVDLLARNVRAGNKQVKVVVLFGL